MKKYFALPAGLGLLFALYTVLLCRVDVQPIGPQGSRVGFATFNGAVHTALGGHMGLYTLTDWLSLAALPLMLGFAALGLVQLVRRKNLLRVDSDILVLGGFYLVVLAFYCLFEVVVINYRPVLIEGYLEASYPSSTTMLMLCVGPTAMMQFAHRLHQPGLRRAVNVSLGVFTGLMVLGRLVSGVHWATDILGGVLLSAALVSLYGGVTRLAADRLPAKRHGNE